MIKAKIRKYHFIKIFFIVLVLIIPAFLIFSYTSNKLFHKRSLSQDVPASPPNLVSKQLIKFSNKYIDLDDHGNVFIKKSSSDKISLGIPVFFDGSESNAYSMENILFSNKNNPKYKEYTTYNKNLLSLSYKDASFIDINSPFMPIGSDSKLCKISFDYKINSLLPIIESSRLKFSYFKAFIDYYNKSKKYIGSDSTELSILRSYRGENKFNYSFIPKYGSAFIRINIKPLGTFSGTYTFNNPKLLKYRINRIFLSKYTYTINNKNGINSVIQNFQYANRSVKRTITINKKTNEIVINKTTNFQNNVQSLESYDPMWIKSQNIKYIAKDMKLHNNDIRLNHYFVTDFTTPYFSKFDNAISLRVNNGFSSTETYHGNNNFYVQINNSHPEDQRYFVIGDGGYYDYIYTQKFLKNSNINTKYTFYLNDKYPITIASRTPYKTHGTLVLTNHGDSTNVDTLKTVMLGASNPKNKLYKHSGFITFKLPITWSFFSITQGHSMGIDNPDFKNVIDLMSKNGIEVLPHTITPIPNDNTRNTLNNYMSKLAKEYPIVDWIDHSLGSGVRCADIKSEGSLPGKNFSLDLFNKYNYKYCWSYLDVTMNKGLNMLTNADTGNHAQILFKNNNLGYDNYSLYQWNSYRPKNFLKEINDSNLKELTTDNGTCILHEYFGHVMQTNKFFKNSINGMEVTPVFNRKLKLIANYRNKKSLWVPTAKDYINYTLLIHNVDIQQVGNNLIILNNNKIPVKGFTYITFNKDKPTYKMMDLKPGNNIAQL